MKKAVHLLIITLFMISCSSEDDVAITDIAETGDERVILDSVVVDSVFRGYQKTNCVSQEKQLSGSTEYTTFIDRVYRSSFVSEELRIKFLSSTALEYESMFYLEPFSAPCAFADEYTFCDVVFDSFDKAVFEYEQEVTNEEETYVTFSTQSLYNTNTTIVHHLYLDSDNYAVRYTRSDGDKELMLKDSSRTMRAIKCDSLPVYDYIYE